MTDEADQPETPPPAGVLTTVKVDLQFGAVEQHWAVGAAATVDGDPVAVLRIESPNSTTVVPFERAEADELIAKFREVFNQPTLEIAQSLSEVHR